MADISRNNNVPQDYYMAMQQQLNQWNQESAQAQMQFQDYMSSTAHQREVRDLLAAGLNPVLSANNGAAALPGAYAGIDSSPISAKMAERQLKMNLETQMYMNKYSVDRGYELGIAQAGIAANAAITGASMAAGAAMYGADQARMSALDVAKQNGTNQVELARYNYTHPTTFEAAGVNAATTMANNAYTAWMNNGGSGRGYNIFYNN